MEYSKLWEKEENCVDAPQYINIFDFMQSELNKSQYCVSERKNNNISSEKIRSAESKKRLTSWDPNFWNEVMEECNASLRFAENGSENVLIAITNRSECFLHLGMFTKCMADMEAVKMANCPKKLEPILKKHQTLCTQKMLLTEELNLPRPKLSFKAHSNIPFFANCLEIKHNEKFGYHVIANDDIDVGRTVVVEESFTSCTLSSPLIGCATCQKTRMNFIPCDKCSTVVFCNNECKNKNFFHIHECGISTDDLGPVKLIVQTILMAISHFVTVQHLMEFVRLTNSVESVMPESIIDAKSKYQMFLKLHTTFPNHAIPNDYVNQAKEAFLHLIRLSAIKKYFTEESQQRFLMHLVLQHTIIAEKNGFTSLQNKIQRLLIINTASSLFNHSCVPNLFNMATHAIQVCITVRPIKKGEQLFVAYAIENTLPSVLRQFALLTKFGFDCECEKCVPRWKSSDRELIKSNKCYKYMMANWQKDYRDDKTRAVLKQFCERFLNECGRLPWCPEMETIMDLYSKYHAYDY